MIIFLEDTTGIGRGHLESPLLPAPGDMITVLHHNWEGERLLDPSVASYRVLEGPTRWHAAEQVAATATGGPDRMMYATIRVELVT